MTTSVYNSNYLAQMPEIFYKTGKYTVDHRTYGGEITLFDFEGHHTMTTMARKIATTESFNQQCRKTCEYRIKFQKGEK